jgi:hypothetical protein
VIRKNPVESFSKKSEIIKNRGGERGKRKEERGKRKEE